MKRIKVADQKETQNFAKEFSKTLKPGMIIALNGDLGAGKSFFVRAVLQSLGLKQEVLSPTFTLCHSYNIGGTQYNHFDLYRVSGIEEADASGLLEILFSNGISFVEWPGCISQILPPNTIYIDINKIGENAREFVIK